MKKASFVFALVILFITWAPTQAQTGASGTWRVDGLGQPFPWEVVLRADGPRLSGAVNSCYSNPKTNEIFNGKIDENTITFQCLSDDGDRMISFTGKLDSDEIVFSWALKTEGSRDPRVDGMFGSSAPPRFTAKRVPNGSLAKAFEELGKVGTVEFAAAVNLVSKDLKAEAQLLSSSESQSRTRSLGGVQFRPGK